MCSNIIKIPQGTEQALNEASGRVGTEDGWFNTDFSCLPGAGGS